ncbi:MAG: nucleoside-diphosphate sugar epimerase [Cypionkella sp.]|uniref:polysaccharide biosynthesis protein n=1 Tax=Cypionkella sp. TaxID=2811411 RepID=UPI00260EA9F1|nr:nucleoside-diphosphate sugar epimerase/dehydratase [Cypionkella sp.]MDB5661328.1 nucleoside-diphosphate sugar epimerase [Cypionkella sp.]
MNPMTEQLLAMSRSNKRAIQVAVDVLLLVAVYFLSMVLKFESFAFVHDLQSWVVLIPVLPTTIFIFVRLGFYRAVLRYIAGRALITILRGAILSGILMSVVIEMADLPVPRAVPLIYIMLTFLSIGGIRFGFRELMTYQQNRRKERVAIYGAGAAGRQLLQVLHQRSDYVPVAFIDDSRQAQGTLVGGIRVYSPTQIERLVRDNGVNLVLLAIPSATKLRRNEILKSLENQPVLIQSVPGLDDIMTGKARIDQINDIKIEDLLGRDPVPPRRELLGANITGKVVMVTGAGGSIGSELCRQILRLKPARLVLYEISELALYTVEEELTDLKATLRSAAAISAVLGCIKSARLVDRTLRHFQVETVYHAAAYKHVPLVEHNIAEGVRNIVFGTATLAEASIAAGVKSFILISSDKSVRPTNIMGASKRLAELVCQALADAPRNNGTTISMVRFGNVLGSSGSVIPLFRRQIEAGGPMTVTHPEITRYFMTIPEAAQLVIQAGAMAQGGEVFVLDMGDPVLITELAAKMARLHGLKPVIFTDPSVEKPEEGEIGIVFTQLRPGEKLHEELLIGNDPKSTSHPRIMSATESRQPLDELFAALDQLAIACDRNDIERIRKIMIEQQTAYQPPGEIVDQFWSEDDTTQDVPEKVGSDPRRLILVHG